MGYTYTKQLETRYDVDVCVVGGGPAGVAAGIAAARQGAKVLIKGENPDIASLI